MRIALAIALVLGLSVPAWADRQHGMQAFFAGDYATALPLLKADAEAGNADSQFDLASMYDNGLGTKRDAAEAARWYHRSAMQGMHMAQYNLATMYEEGTGVAKDLVQAYFFYALASNGGPPYADRNRKSVGRRLSPTELEQARRLAQDFRPTPEHPAAAGAGAPPPSAPPPPETRSP